MTDHGDRQRKVRSRDLSAVDQRLLGQPLRLLPLYELPQVADEPRSSGPTFTPGAGKRPGVLLRVGNNDLHFVCETIGEVIEPAGIVVALSDAPEVVRSAARASRRVGVPLLTDTVFFRCAMPGGRISPSLARLSYAPEPEHGPWTTADLGRTAVPGVVRAAFQEQDGRQHGAWMAPTVVIDRDPRTLELADRLLASSIDTRPAFGRQPLVAPLVIDLAAFSALDAQLRLVNALARHGPDVYLVSLAGTATSGKRLASAIRLLMLLKDLGVPVLLAKAGALRAFAIAFGLAGFESGLGRLDSFELSHFRGKGGAGRWPAYFEVPELLCAVHPQIAAQIARSGALGADCPCPGCREGWTPGDIRGTVVHDAFVINADARRGGGEISSMVAMLKHSISDARYAVDELQEAGVDVSKQTAHLPRWAEAVELLVRWGLDEPGAAGRMRDAA
ncbi:MAG TPA: hypothetical protein VF549_08330 [Solirubrobacteraceae bacterium]